VELRFDGSSGWVAQHGGSGDATGRLTGLLLQAQQRDGGWGAYPARQPNTESTAFAALALGLARLPDPTSAREASTRGVQWLLARQRPDGSWPFTDQTPQGAWAGAPAVLALARLGLAGPAVRKGAGWLAGRKGLILPERMGWRERIAVWVGPTEPPDRVNELDGTIPGWPWIDGTFSWVEPTAVAMLALRAASRELAVAADPAVAARLRDGQRLLVDRATPDGGWNYGNKRVLDYDLEPFPDTSAWALLALRGAPGAGPLVERGLARLDVLMRDNRSALARALAVLARRAHGRDAASFLTALAAQCAGTSRDPRVTDARSQALALLALAGPPLPLSV
jgi:hypothetical protein